MLEREHWDRLARKGMGGVGAVRERAAGNEQMTYRARAVVDLDTRNECGLRQILVERPAFHADAGRQNMFLLASRTPERITVWLPVAIETRM